MKHLLILGFMMGLAGCSMWGTGEVGIKTEKKAKCYKMVKGIKTDYTCKKY